MMAAGMLAATSCTDFNDYNEVPAEQNVAAGRTLWENIKDNPDLSNFRQLVEQTGFQDYLSENRAITVWAPSNNYLQLTDYQGMSDSLLLARVIKNHVAEYRYLASGQLDNERIHMLNEKSFSFNGNGNYTFGGVSVGKPNQPSGNGIMHILDGVVPFYPNLYEYVAADTVLNDLHDYVMKYEETTLDLEKSVKGPIVDGEQTYIDKVYVTNNSILNRNRMNAKLQSEDSVYTMIMPTDEAYQDMYDRVKSLYKYIGKTTVEMPAQYTQASSSVTKDVSLENATDLTDSISKEWIIRNLVYSHTSPYNAAIGNGETLDTIYSTRGTKLSNPQALLEDRLVGEPIKMSNGFGRQVDSLAFMPWETYNPEIESLFSRNLLKAFNHSLSLVNVRDEAGWILGPEYTSFRYTLITPKAADTSKPELFISLPNVLSGTYKVYCVFLPAALGSGVNKPTAMNFQLSYTNASNKVQTYTFCANPDDPTHKASTTGNWSDNPKPSLNTAFVNDTNKVYKADTIALGTFTFPVCYKGLANDNERVAPHLHVSSPLSLFNKTQMANYSREFRIWAIILRPVDYDEYLNSNNTNDNE